MLCMETISKPCRRHLVKGESISAITRDLNVIELLHQLARAIPRHSPQPIAQLVDRFDS